MAALQNVAFMAGSGRKTDGFSDKFLVLDNQWLVSPIILSENAGMKYGYARVSTDDQNSALQTAALKKAGCKKIFEDRGMSGVVAKRPSLTRCVNTLQAGDTLIVWKLDRLGRSLSDLITFLDDLKQRGIEFQSITEAINTGTPAGRAMW